LNHSYGAADTGCDGDGLNGAVERAGSALHAGAQVSDKRFLPLHGEDAMRAHLQAHAAADAQFGIKPKRDRPFEIS
jgi:hypothetical protein